jgi:integrase
MASISVLQIGARWRAQVKHPGRKSISRTWDTKREAEQWGRRIAAEMEGQVAQAASGEMTVAELVRHYRRVRDELTRPIDPASNTHYMLEHLAEDLGAERVRDLSPQRLAKWARERAAQGAGGYTVNMELSQLGTAIRHTASFLGVTLPDVVGAARPLLHYAQLITGGNRRTRRPSEDELARLLVYLDQRNRIVGDAVRVAAVTGLRRAELARIEWADVDELRRAVLVRQRKHPRRIEARDEWVPLLGESWDVVQRQPSKAAGGRIFPVSRETLTDSVTDGTRELGIPDLRLHDMRREATSRLRELGFDADARKAVTGHKSDAVHERYVAVTLESLHAQFDAAAPGTQPRPPRRRKAADRQS